MSATRPLCFAFRDKGKCKYGDKCRYSHGTTEDRLSPPSDPIQNWRRQLKSRSTGRFATAKSNDLNLNKFFQDALKYVQEDAATMQEVVTLLGKDDGLQRVRELVDKFNDSSDVQLKPSFSNGLLSLFKIVLFPSVAQSNVLEPAVVSIYNCVYGPNGARAVALYNVLVEKLLFIDHPTGDDDFDYILKFFVQMTIVNGSSNLNESLSRLAEILTDKALVVAAEIKGSQHFAIRCSANQLNRHFDLGKAVPMIDSKPRKITLSKAAFKHSQKPPGGRHDNDHANICEIKIMPTYEEILCEEPEYLPNRDGTDLFGLTHSQALLDRHFRLLREDTIGQLRDAVRETLKSNAAQGDEARSAGLRKHVYDNVVFLDTFASARSGLEFFIRVDSPVRHSKDEKSWWERSKRLQVEALVCIIGLQNTITYCTVSAQGPPSIARRLTVVKEEDGEIVKEDTQFQRLQQYSQLKLYGCREGAYLTLKPVSTSPDDLVPLLNAVMQTNKLAHVKLVEFPGVLLPTFYPTLNALQNMHSRGELPFAEILAADSDELPVMSAPPYAKSTDLAYDLACLTEAADVPLAFSPEKSFSMDKLIERTTLDAAQARAVIYALSSSLALIQGPPGTGKSFTGIALIKILLQIKEQAQLGPIVCVCYTNHALDQLLEHLHNAGVKQMIRVGSRSKSEILDDVNLNVVAKTVEETRTEGHARRSTYFHLNEKAESMGDSIHELNKADQMSKLKPYLQEHYPSHYDELFGSKTDADGFELYTRTGRNPLKSWLRGNSRGTRPDLQRPLTTLQRTQLQSLSKVERKSLYEFWVREIQNQIANDILDATESFDELSEKYKRIKDDRNLRCLAAADIIGVTTSGLARQLDVFRKLPSKVLLCEEAGEVLEANLLPALLPSLEHVILIGDHLQLRPQVQNYELSRESARGKEYAMDLSLFERLVQDPYGSTPNITYETLEVQRRMHPSISRLIRESLYPNLLDFENVAAYPEVSGMRKRLFWLDHSNLEDKPDLHHSGSTSRSNVFEVRTVTALVSHLIRQGIYLPNDIAVLTPYLAQLFRIRQALSAITEVAIDERDLEQASRQGVSITENESTPNRHAHISKTTLLRAVRVATVDNFQGEEAKVIIVSLVRSNDRNSCGFLRTPNRINVLLSRAQHGMYIIGNKSTAASVQMWAKVISVLEETDCIGDELALQCPRHPATILTASDPEHFAVISPEGGCSLMCGRRLLCGHACRQKCHADKLHEAVRCLESCPRSLSGCDHSCPEYCGDACVEKCSVVLQRDFVELPCGHVLKNPQCWQKQSPEKVLCMEIVKKEVPDCHHQLLVTCSTNVSTAKFKCTSQCEGAMLCGHACQQKCSECRYDITGQKLDIATHGKCRKVCDRKYDNCSHFCTEKCHEGRPCAPCSAICGIKCSHSQCTRKCSEPCAPCASPTCTSECPHSRCTMPCAAPCNWTPCSQRCVKFLECGHQCPSLCGEQCPSSVFCQICASSSIKTQLADMVMFTNYEDIDLAEEPCIVLPCGHILTVSSLDGIMEMREYYEMTPEGVAIRPVQKGFDLGQKVSVCPHCRGSLRSVSRYGRIIRQVLLAESTKRFIHWSNSLYVPLAQETHSAQEKLVETSKIATSTFAQRGQISIALSGEALSDLDTIITYSQSSRYRTLRKAYVKILKYAEHVRVEEQPFKRVWDLVQHSRRSRGTDPGTFEIDSAALQTRQHLLARALLLRCHLAVLCDFFSNVSIDPNSIQFRLDDEWKECKDLATCAKGSFQPGIQAEAHLFYARYCAIAQYCFVTVSSKLSRQNAIPQDRLDQMLSEVDKLRNRGLNEIRFAEQICSINAGSTSHLIKEIGDVKIMVQRSTLSDVLLPEEMKQIYEAMTFEFGGTGHWYYCENRHPFTIGECGMPMEVARCPQCGARIGGQSHRAVAGVTHAADLERQMRGLTVAGN